MDPHALEVLEFAKIRAVLADCAASELGIEAAAALSPSDDPQQVAVELRRTGEARQILDRGEDIPLAGLHDVREILRQARIGSVLTGQELRLVADTVGCVGRVKRFFGEREECVELGALAAGLTDKAPLVDAIERAIGPEGDVLDDASPELRRLRRLARQLADRLQTTLRRIVGRLSEEDSVQEAVVTIRAGRYCIPIKSSHQHRFEGIVHDRSASGQTVFMEPTEVVRHNNELRDVQLAEREEMHRILRDLSMAVGAAAGDLERNLLLLQQLDLARAKGRLSVRLAACAPRMAADGVFDLVGARHPLLAVQTESVVPIDVRLGEGYTLLLITGPNTGGKTVALKTIGLLTLMAHAGLHVPVEPGSRIPFCRRVYADIGDEQSIEQSLSTFGSHLGQIVHVLAEAGSGDLVLLDELGAGTDPAEGAALAEAVLVTLLERDCRVVATTHHGSLKAFAYQTAGVENASVEFDVATLAPTYRLQMGIPGASHAFEIAARLGLPEDVLALARDRLPAEHHDAAAIITEMQARRRRLEGELRAAEHEAAAASHRRRELERERRRLRELEAEIREQARREAVELLAAVQAEADEILSALRRADREGRETEQARRRLRELQERARSQSESLTPTRRADPDTNYGEGDVVEVLSLRSQGTVTAVLENGEVQVQVGPMRMQLSPREIALVERRGPAAEPVRRGRVTIDSSFSPEIHLRGQTVDEALLALDHFLDRACLAGVPEVRIVHGKGTGTLRQAVHAYLRDYPHVVRFEHPPDRFGGRGVTVAYLEP